MRRSLIAIIIVIFAWPAFAAFTITNIGGNNNTAGATIAVTVGPGGVPSGSVIIFGVFEQSATPGGSVADTALNSYTAVTSSTVNGGAGASFGAMFYAKNATALVSGNTITFTKQTTGDITAVTAAYITGASTNPLDAGAVAVAFGSSATPSVTSGAPAGSGEFFIGLLATETITFSQAAGWTNVPSQSTVTTIGEIVGGNRNNAGSGTLTFNPGTTAAADWADMIAAFKAPGAATKASSFLNLLGVGQ